MAIQKTAAFHAARQRGRPGEIKFCSQQFSSQQEYLAGHELLMQFLLMRVAKLETLRYGHQLTTEEIAAKVAVWAAEQVEEIRASAD